MIGYNGSLQGSHPVLKQMCKDRWPLRHAALPDNYTQI